MSYRELGVLIRHLPTESWTQTALVDDGDDLDELVAPDQPVRFGPWALTNHQLAALMDAINVLSYKVHVSGGLEPAAKPPEPTPRPGLKQHRSTQPGLSEAAVLYLNKLRPTGG